jgi:hypothetical protein
MLSGTVWTHTVAELDLRMSGNIRFHFLPGIVLVANLFAETANGQKTSQDTDLLGQSSGLRGYPVDQKRQ